MSKQMPPTPPANRSKQDKGSNKSEAKQQVHNAARPSEHGAKPDETGDQANISQNTPHPGSRHDG